MKSNDIAVLIVLMTVAGCGTLPEERAVSGAGIGAASGAIVGAVTTLAVGPGALIGALGGGLVGALTNRDQVNMGEPVWKHGRSGAAARPPVRDTAGTPGAVASPPVGVVIRVQQRLAHLGYQPGPADGIPGPRTSAAVRAFQKDHGLDVDGAMTVELADRVLGTPKLSTFSI